MYKKIRFTIFNILLLCVAFGMLFFIKVESFALTNASVISYGYPNDTQKDIYSLSYSLDSNARFCFYYHTISGWTNNYGTASRVDLCSNLFSRVDVSWSREHYTNSGNVENPIWVHQERTSGSTTEGLSIPSGVGNSSYYPNYFEHSIYVSDGWGNEYVSSSGLPVFYNIEDVYYYLDFGTLPEKPFDDEIKLDKFKVYMKGEWNWDLVRPQFNTVVVCPIWSNPDINDVEISIYAVDPSFRYNTVNYSYDRNMSGQMQQLDISGLTLHGQKFVVRATPFTSNLRGVAIQYEFTFPETFDQPIGQLVITEPNQYPYSTTIDVSGNDVPIEWTVTQTPIYVYETNNVENYYYGEPVSYPVPEITENTTNNYYEEYINNYYNDYSTVVNNYETNFDIDITDVSSGDIQNTYDDIGNFFKGFGGFVGKLALLFNGLFPFLSPSVSVVLVTMVGIIAVGGVVILFLKVFHIL